MDDIYWRMSKRDLETKLKLRVGEESARISQEFQTLSNIISLAFGGKDTQVPDPPKNAAEAQMQFNALFKR